MNYSSTACGLRVVMCLIVINATTVPASAQTPAPAAVDLNYGLDASLLYLTTFGRPDAASINAPAPAKVATPRTIGLRKLAIDATWRSAASAELGLTLRPDAESRPVTVDGEHREVDTRSGTPYRSEPSVRLLDAYHIGVGVGAGLAASLGVYSDLAPTRASYQPTAGFGLGVRFPMKFSALKLRWQRQGVAPDRAIEAPPSSFLADLYVMQGHDDRVETVGSGALYDEGPIAADPYQGGAVYFGYTPSRRGEVGLMAGTYDAAAASGRRTEVFGQLIGSLTYPVLSRQGKLTLDLRYATEKWRGEGVDYKPREQQSVSITHALGVTNGSFWLFGGHWGHSDRLVAGGPTDALATQTGYQIETGWQAALNDGVSVQALATHEHREEEDDLGGSRGGFVNEEGDERRTLRRFAFEISYALNDNG